MIKSLWLCGLLCAVGVGGLALDPGFDLAASRVFFIPPARFVGDTSLGEVARYIAWVAPIAGFCALVVAGVCGRAGLLPPRFALRRRSLVLIVLSFALSPGLFVYATLKPLAHRPRPHSIAAFGGHEAFRPVGRFDGSCTHSCSFPSGETAGAAWTLAPASLVPPPWRGWAIGAALAFTAATGLLRLAFGGHFLSDVLAAAALTILAVLIARALAGLLDRDAD